MITARARSVEVESPRTRSLFLALCFYLLTQCFTIPLVRIGPSWAVWPTLSDIAIVILAVCSVRFIGSPMKRPSGTPALRALIVLFLGCALSYLVFTVGGVANLDLEPVLRRGTAFGLFQLYRLAQVILVFWVVSRIPLSPGRVTILVRIVTVSLVLTVAGIALTFFSILQPATIAPHLPPSSAISGPWAYYVTSHDEGLGTIGYNHAHVASQVLLLLALRLHLRPRLTVANLTLVGAVVMACFISGSRSGLAAALLFAIVMVGRNPVVAMLFGLIVGTLVLLVPSTWLLVEPVIVMAERQEALLDPMNPSSLSGRDIRWYDSVQYLNEAPTRWLTGIGFGGAVDGPGHAHLLYLHIVLELGLAGLVAFCFGAFALLRRLRQVEPESRPLFWACIALLFSSLSQETLYPVPAFGGYLPFLACVVAIALAPARIAREV